MGNSTVKKVKAIFFSIYFSFFGAVYWSVLMVRRGLNGVFRATRLKGVNGWRCFLIIERQNRTNIKKRQEKTWFKAHMEQIPLTKCN